MPVECQSQLRYKGANHLRQRCVLSLLSGRPLKITDIRSMQNEPGLKDYEVDVLKMLCQVVNGCRLDINQTGTQLHFTPGMLSGGAFSWQCSTDRCLSYYLEPLIYIAPFCKVPVRATLKGVTNAPGEPSVDAIIAAWLPVLSTFVLDTEALELKIKCRGLQPSGGGQVFFTCPVRRKLRPLTSMKIGQFRKIRGTAFVCRVSATMASRAIVAAKAILSDFLSDVFITLDQRKGPAAGLSPGFGMVLWASSTDECVLTAEAMSHPSTSASETSAAPSDNILTPEEIGAQAARSLLAAIYRGGCVDATVEPLCCLFAALGDPDVSRFVTGPLNDYTVHMLRHMRDTFNVTAHLERHDVRAAVLGKADKIAPDDGEDGEQFNLGCDAKVLVSIVGVGYSNLTKMVL